MADRLPPRPPKASWGNVSKNLALWVLVGLLVTAIPLVPPRLTGPAWAWLLAAFVLFRIFDIAKPWPIRSLDRSVHGGFGIMLDDLVAGAYAALVLGAARWML